MNGGALEWVSVYCPYCGEPLELAIDTSVDVQSYTEDCQVCCCPMVVRVSVDEEGEIDVGVDREGGE
jgi:hypothetical protein